MVVQGFQDSLLVNLKYKSRNLKCRKTSGPKGQFSKSTKISKTKEHPLGEVAFLSNVADNVFI